MMEWISPGCWRLKPRRNAAGFDALSNKTATMQAIGLEKRFSQAVCHAMIDMEDEVLGSAFWRSGFNMPSTSIWCIQTTIPPLMILLINKEFQG
jgi:hypothetical protein